MKGFGRLSDRGPITLQGAAFVLSKSILFMAAAVAQVANAFHVAPGSAGTAVDLLRKCVIGRTHVPIPTGRSWR